MLILGIETSCDETGVAVYDTQRGLLAHRLYSQIALHSEYGGVVPELASRDHVRKLLPLIDEVLHAAAAKPEDFDGIAYTAGPGLIGALLVGACFGRSLAFAWDVPAIGVHHMEGHLLAPLLEPNPPAFPFVALLVSGGHTQLVDVEGIGQYQLVANRSMMPQVKHSTRPPRCLTSTTLAARRWPSLPQQAIATGSASRGQ